MRLDEFDSHYTLQPATGSTTATVALGRDDLLPSWRAALLYKPMDIGSIYFGAGTSFNPSGEDIALTTATQAIEPEKTTAYEFGTKWDVLNRNLALNAAFFYTIKDNARTPGLTRRTR